MSRTSIGRDLPRTGEPVGSFAGAAEKTCRHAEMLAEKDAAIHRAAKTPPGRDVHAANAARAKKGWNKA
jgi:hypothetical protein